MEKMLITVLTELEYFRKVQFGIVASEKLAGNIVKEESAKGASVGLLMAQNVIRKFAKDWKNEDNVERSAKKAVIEEHNRAVKKFGEFPTAHHGLAVIEEEFLGLRNEVFWGIEGNTAPSKTQKECIQLAAMAYRFLIDVCGMDD